MVFYKEENCVIYIKADGHITAQFCPELKKQVFLRIDTLPPINNIYVDLSECTYMDSTFLGLLVGFSKKVKATGGLLQIQHSQEVCINLFKQMGMDRILSINEVDIQFPSDMTNLKNNCSVTAETLLSAHEDLMSLSDENKNRFSSLHEMLSKQVQDKKE